MTVVSTAWAWEQTARKAVAVARLAQSEGKVETGAIRYGKAAFVPETAFPHPVLVGGTTLGLPVHFWPLQQDTPTSSTPTHSRLRLLCVLRLLCWFPVSELPHPLCLASNSKHPPRRRTTAITRRTTPSCCCSRLLHSNLFAEAFIELP